MRTRRRLRFVLALLVCAVLAPLLASGSNAAIVRFGGIELRAFGDFRPHHLPRNRRAPIELRGSARVLSTDGGPPPQLSQIILDFDRDGHLSTRGLPTCDPASIEHASVVVARRRCADAIVGKGTVGAIVLVDGRWIRVVGKLTLFNGPPEGALATVVAHAQPLSLPDEIYVVSIPIVRTSGEFRYRATVEVPEVFNGAGVLTDIDVHIGRKYRSHGRELSYASARCRDGALSLHGHLTFADGTIIDGTIERYCVPLGF